MANFARIFRNCSLTVLVLFAFVVNTTALFAQNDTNRDNRNDNDSYRRTDHPNAWYNRGRYNNSRNGLSNTFRGESEYPAPKGIISWYPIPMIFSHLMIGYENSVTQKTSLKGMFAFGAAQNSDLYNLKDMRSLHGELQFRYYPSGNGLRGIFLGGFVLVKNMQGKYSYYTNSYPYYTQSKNVNATAGQLGFVMGYQGTIKGVGSVEVFFGGGLLSSDYNKPDSNNPNYNYSDYNKTFADQSLDPYTTGVQWRGGLSFGIVTHKWEKKPDNNNIRR